jgi:3-hydroxyisobutyrate dehydrogenase-like beta-hydroxyacid dehydrogenase
VLATAPDACRACVIVTSTCDPDRIAALPGLCPPGMQLVEAPISGTSREVAAGGAVFLVGGDAEAVATAAPVLGLLGRAWHPTWAQCAVRSNRHCPRPFQERLFSSDIFQET